MKRRAAAAILVLLHPSCPALRASGESAPPPAKKPYDHYKQIEDRNIFAPVAPPAPAGTAGAAPSPSARPTVLTGVVYDARSGAYRGLLETPGQAEAKFVGAGDATPLGRVLRVTLDEIVVGDPDRPLAVPVGGAFTTTAAAAAPPAPSSPSGKSVDTPASGDDNKSVAAPEEPDASLDEKTRSVLDRLRQRRRRGPPGAAEGENR